MNTFCHYFNQATCKSCDLITLDYAHQLQQKESALLEALKSIKLPPLSPSVSSKTTGFRNKAKFAVTGTMNDPILGLTGEDNLDHGRELLECPLHLPEINQMLPLLKDFITLAKLEPYQVSSKKGELKGIIIFYSESSAQSYLRLILRSQEAITRIKKHIPFLKENIPSLVSISANIQPVAHAILEGDLEISLTDQDFIEHKLGPVTLNIHPRAFVQTNQVIAEKLYQTAADWIKDLRSEKFMELFCGQGAFSFFCADSIREGLGIEINQSAIDEANRTAKKFHYAHLKFKQSDAASVGDEIDKFNPDVVLVNPPRRGLAQAVNLFKKYRPENVIYSSCSYETLAQDLSVLKDLYEVKKIQIFDMFPNTSHFEVLVELRLI